MTTNYIQVPPNSTGLKVDMNELTVNGNVVERQSVSIADPGASDHVANVIQAVSGGQSGLLTFSVPTEVPQAVYGASFAGVNAGTGATTDFFTIFGSASKQIRVIQIGLSSTTATAAVYYDLVLKTCSAAPSGGAATTITGAQFVSTDAAPTAVVKFWTTPPTPATYTGSLTAWKQFSPITGTPASLPPPAVFDFGPPRMLKPIILTGVAQGLSVTLNQVTPANASNFTGWVYWMET